MALVQGWRTTAIPSSGILWSLVLWVCVSAWKEFCDSRIDTLYEGGFLRAELSFPHVRSVSTKVLTQEYPLLPPKMKFKTPMWHPNSMFGNHTRDCSAYALPLSLRGWYRVYIDLGMWTHVPTNHSTHLARMNLGMKMQASAGSLYIRLNLFSSRSLVCWAQTRPILTRRLILMLLSRFEVCTKRGTHTHQRTLSAIAKKYVSGTMTSDHAVRVLEGTILTCS